MSKFVLAALGTYGDVNPYVAVALGLKERGHQVLVATSASHRQKVESEGLPFHALRPDLFHVMNSSPEIAARGNDLRTGTEYILKTLVLPVLRQTFDDLRDACAGADLMVIHSVLFAAPLVAEKLGLKWTSVILSPGIFLSAFDPPVLPPVAWFHASRHLGAWPHRMLFRWVDRVTRQWMRPVDELRKEVHLPFSPKNPVRDSMISPFGTLGWFSPLMGSAAGRLAGENRSDGVHFFRQGGSGPRRPRTRQVFGARRSACRVHTWNERDYSCGGLL
jgi:rhamnosyltransferase subunit B